jgi:branched-chain amino acid transport system permease protein
MGRLFAPRFRWPLALSAVTVTLFVFYTYVLPHTNSSVREGFRHWLPVTAVNESLIWVILALGLNVVVGYAGLLDLGFVAFWAIGTYSAGWLMSAFMHKYHLDFNLLGNPQIGEESGVHISFWLVLAIGAAICAVCGLIIGAPTLRLRSDYLALVTLGFGEIIPQFFKNDPGGLTNGDRGIQPVDKIRIFGWTLGAFDHTYRFLILALLVAAVIFISLRLREGKLGRAWLAIREDQLAAAAMGVPLMRTKLAAYAIGAVAGGIGGVAYAVHIGSAQPSGFDFSKSIILLGMVVLGGMGNVWGVLLGAFMLSWFNNTGLEQVGNTINDTFGTKIEFSGYNFLIFGLVLVLTMLFRREGLLPESRTRLVLHEADGPDVDVPAADAAEPAPQLVGAADASRQGGTA